MMNEKCLKLKSGIDIAIVDHIKKKQIIVLDCEQQGLTNSQVCESCVEAYEEFLGINLPQVDEPELKREIMPTQKMVDEKYEHQKAMEEAEAIEEQERFEQATKRVMAESLKKQEVEIAEQQKPEVLKSLIKAKKLNVAKLQKEVEELEKE